LTKLTIALPYFGAPSTRRWASFECPWELDGFEGLLTLRTCSYVSYWMLRLEKIEQ
jgi:hypothetical protein